MNNQQAHTRKHNPYQVRSVHPETIAIMRRLVFNPQLFTAVRDCLTHYDENLILAFLMCYPDNHLDLYDLADQIHRSILAVGRSEEELYERVDTVVAVKQLLRAEDQGEKAVAPKADPTLPVSPLHDHVAKDYLVVKVDELWVCLYRPDTIHN